MLKPGVVVGKASISGPPVGFSTKPTEKTNGSQSLAAGAASVDAEGSLEETQQEQELNNRGEYLIDRIDPKDDMTLTVHWTGGTERWGDQATTEVLLSSLTPAQQAQWRDRANKSGPLYVLETPPGLYGKVPGNARNKAGGRRFNIYKDAGTYTLGSEVEVFSNSLWSAAKITAVKGNDYNVGFFSGGMLESVPAYNIRELLDDRRPRGSWYVMGEAVEYREEKATVTEVRSNGYALKLGNGSSSIVTKKHLSPWYEQDQTWDDGLKVTGEDTCNTDKVRMLRVVRVVRGA